MKITKDALVKPITTIINQMLINGIFPEKFKIALYKKDDETLFNNYRPISLLPAISKIFEKVIFKQLYQFFTDKNYCTGLNMVLELNTQQNMQLLRKLIEF